jgi:hypothetical protein
MLMLRQTQELFSGLSGRIDDLLKKLSNIEREKIQLIGKYNKINDLVEQKTGVSLEGDKGMEELSQYFDSYLKKEEVDYSKLNELFKSGIKFQIGEDESDICRLVDSTVNKQFEVLLSLYHDLLGIDRKSYNLKKFRMLYSEDLRTIIKSIKPASLVSDNYFIEVSFNKEGDLKVQLAKILFRFINVDKLLNILIPNDTNLRESFGYIIKSETNIGDFYVYSIDELYNVLIKLAKEVVDFMKINCRNPVSEMKKTIEMRITLINSLLLIFNETLQKLLEVIKEFNRYPDVFLIKEEEELQKEGKIITYVKLRCDDNNYNQRFQVFVNKNKKELIIGHNPYLGGDSGTTNRVANNSQGNQFMYDAYGKFDKVFLPGDKNEDIAKDLIRLKDSINNGKSLCLIAYGASGAGKTSTLLYFRGVPGVKEPVNGIIPNLCNNIDSKYQNITITAKELRADYKDTVKNYWQILDVLDKPAKFRRESNGWITDDTRYSVIDYPRLHETSICEKGEPFSGINRTQKEFGRTLGDFIASLIDIRLNCGTTNNPDSSRTHMLVFIKFGDSGPTLIVADLAGVEKPFDCDSLVVLENFARNKTYYRNINTELSKIVGGALSKNYQTLSENGDISSITVNDLIKYEFVKYDKAGTTFPLTISTFFNNPEAVYNNLYKSGLYNEYMKSLELFCKFINNRGYFQLLKERIIDEKIKNITLEDVNKVEYYFNKVGIDDFYNEMSKPITAADALQQYRKRLSGIFTGKLSTYESSIEGFILKKDNKKLVQVVMDEILKLENYFTKLRELTTEVCRTRTKEGYFINKSLGELRNLIRMYASSSGVGPSFLVACYPIICPEYLDSTECLPKFDSKLPENFISSIVETIKGGGISNIDELQFCVFNVCNLTNNKETDPIRQIYSPLGDLLAPSLESLDKVETVRRKLLEKLIKIPQNNYSQKIDEIRQKINMIKTKYLEFLGLYSTYKKSMEQIDLSKRPSDNKQMEYFIKSKQIWSEINILAKEIKVSVLEKEDKYYKLSLIEDFTQLNTIKSEISRIIKDTEEENATTMIGTMSFIEEISKLGRRELKCYVENGLEFFKLNSDNYIFVNGMIN